MLKFAIFLALSITGTVASAQSASQFLVVSVCRPVAQLSKPFYAGLAQVQTINSVEVKMSQSSASMSINVDVFEEGYGATPNRVVNKTETYSLSRSKTGSMLEWEPDSSNEIEIPYVITHHTETHVLTAGPIPPGTYKADIDLVLISSYPTGRPTTGVLHLPLTCDSTFKY